MNDLAIIADKIAGLRSLSTQDAIFLDDVGEEFRRDLQHFIVGETLTIRSGKLSIGIPLYKKWLDKIRKKGFDYEIDFK